MDDFLIGSPKSWGFVSTWNYYSTDQYGYADLHMGFDAATGGHNLRARHAFSSLARNRLSNHLGASLAAGDFDGDGAIDLLIGAPGIDDIQTDAGAVYLILNPF